MVKYSGKRIIYILMGVAFAVSILVSCGRTYEGTDKDTVKNASQALDNVVSDNYNDDEDTYKKISSRQKRQLKKYSAQVLYGGLEQSLADIFSAKTIKTYENDDLDEETDTERDWVIEPILSSANEYISAFEATYPGYDGFKSVKHTMNIIDQYISKADKLEDIYGIEVGENLITKKFYIDYRLNHASDGTLFGHIRKTLQDKFQNGYNWVSYDVNDDGDRGDTEYVLHSDDPLDSGGVHEITCYNADEYLTLTSSDGFEQEVPFYVIVKNDEKFMKAHRKYNTYMEKIEDEMILYSESVRKQ